MSDSEFQSFTQVAPWYDVLMAGVPYEQWVRYLEELLKEFGHVPELVLDLACGTGKVSRLLAKKGYEVVGVDGSLAMIEEARRRTRGGEAEYVCQRMERLDLDRRFDLTVSFFDSLNYLTDPADLQECCNRVFRHLHPGGLFVFDMNGEYAFEANMFNQESHGPRRKIEYSWRSDYDRTTRLCSVYMEFRVREGGKPKEFREVHVQRAYSVEEVNGMLEEAGFTVLAVYNAYTLEPARPKSDRIFWVARRPTDDE
jgi:ubiquinone/menaquinone biosynthesis C-methylase UbiE